MTVPQVLTTEYLASEGLAPDFPERFWKKVDKTNPNGCWLWTGATTDGCGQIMRAGSGKRSIKANRASWVMHRGPIPHRQYVVHIPPRNVPLCVNPAHLRLVPKGFKWSWRARPELRADPQRNARFEVLIAPHIDRGRIVALDLSKNYHDTQDIVQEACWRAFRFLDDCPEAGSAGWFVRIVHNCAMNFFKVNWHSHLPLDKACGDDNGFELHSKVAAIDQNLVYNEVFDLDGESC